MPGVTKEQIQAAREADLFTYLQFHEPGVLKQDGPNFRHKEHDSLVYVTGKRYWYWNSRGRSINALDYLIQIRGYGLVDAVHALVGGEIPQEPAYRSTAEIQVSKEPEKKTFALPWARRCATAAVFYLQKRGISSEVIRQCLQAGIFYEARYHGEPVCVFVGKDDSGKAKFACMRSISGNLKKDVYGSDKGYNFCYPPQSPGSRHVAVFEAPIDALSHGLMKKTLLRDLKNEFLEFIEALEIYFYEFVEKASDVHPISQIREIEPNYIISFNYTHTEKYYGINNVHHIHGVIRDDLDCGSNNMVLGVNDYDNKDFIYFVKYFQRIQKHCGVDYKYIINEQCIFKSSDEFDKEYNDYELYIYGHSLDETDKDVLKFVIGDFDDRNQFQMKARKVIIYYYDQQDFELKVINLITLFGRDIVEKNMDDNKIIFIKIDSNID